MPGHEGHPPASHLTHDDGVAGRPVRSLDSYFVSRVEEFIKPRTADDADLRLASHGVNVPGAQYS
jgi:hypothetical protein